METNSRFVSDEDIARDKRCEAPIRRILPDGTDFPGFAGCGYGATPEEALAHAQSMVIGMRKMASPEFAARYEIGEPIENSSPRIAPLFDLTKVSIEGIGLGGRIPAFALSP